MENYIVNKTFANNRECEEWEAKNIPNRTYKGKMVLMVGHQSECGKDEITITNIMVC
ncbi:MAG: hypothetical protein LKG11_00770 [Bacilli bacterium]|jgi:glutathione peroxidase-family protein|nr:hypothetical protein [Bacilli bacterium]